MSILSSMIAVAGFASGYASFFDSLMKQSLTVLKDSPGPNMCRCSDCGHRFKISSVKQEQDRDWETGQVEYRHICPDCEDGGCIDDYYMSHRQSRAYRKWKALRRKK